MPRLSIEVLSESLDAALTKMRELRSLAGAGGGGGSRPTTPPAQSTAARTEALATSDAFKKLDASQQASVLSAARLSQSSDTLTARLRNVGLASEAIKSLDDVAFPKITAPVLPTAADLSRQVAGVVSGIKPPPVQLPVALPGASLADAKRKGEQVGKALGESQAKAEKDALDRRVAGPSPFSEDPAVRSREEAAIQSRTRGIERIQTQINNVRRLSNLGELSFPSLPQIGSTTIETAQGLLETRRDELAATRQSIAELRQKSALDRESLSNAKATTVPKAQQERLAREEAGRQREALTAERERRTIIGETRRGTISQPAQAADAEGDPELKKRQIVGEQLRNIAADIRGGTRNITAEQSTLLRETFGSIPRGLREVGRMAAQGQKDTLQQLRESSGREARSFEIPLGIPPQAEQDRLTQSILDNEKRRLAGLKQLGAEHARPDPQVDLGIKPKPVKIPAPSVDTTGLRDAVQRASENASTILNSAFGGPQGVKARLGGPNMAALVQEQIAFKLSDVEPTLIKNKEILDRAVAESLKAGKLPSEVDPITGTIKRADKESSLAFSELINRQNQLRARITKQTGVVQPLFDMDAFLKGQQKLNEVPALQSRAESATRSRAEAELELAAATKETSLLAERSTKAKAPLPVTSDAAALKTRAETIARADADHASALALQEQAQKRYNAAASEEVEIQKRLATARAEAGAAGGGPRPPVLAPPGAPGVPSPFRPGPGGIIAPGQLLSDEPIVELEKGNQRKALLNKRLGQHLELAQRFGVLFGASQSISTISGGALQPFGVLGAAVGVGAAAIPFTKATAGPVVAALAGLEALAKLSEIRREAEKIELDIRQVERRSLSRSREGALESQNVRAQITRASGTGAAPVDQVLKISTALQNAGVSGKQFEDSLRNALRIQRDLGVDGAAEIEKLSQKYQGLTEFERSGRIAKALTTEALGTRQLNEGVTASERTIAAQNRLRLSLSQTAIGFSAVGASITEGFASNIEFVNKIVDDSPGKFVALTKAIGLVNPAIAAAFGALGAGRIIGRGQREQDQLNDSKLRERIIQEGITRSLSEATEEADRFNSRVGRQERIQIALQALELEDKYKQSIRSSATEFERFEGIQSARGTRLLANTSATTPAERLKLIQQSIRKEADTDAEASIARAKEVGDALEDITKRKTAVETTIKDKLGVEIIAEETKAAASDLAATVTAIRDIVGFEPTTNVPIDTTKLTGEAEKRRPELISLDEQRLQLEGRSVLLGNEKVKLARLLQREDGLSIFNELSKLRLQEQQLATAAKIANARSDTEVKSIRLKQTNDEREAEIQNGLLVLQLARQRVEFEASIGLRRIQTEKGVQRQLAALAAEDPSGEATDRRRAPVLIARLGTEQARSELDALEKLLADKLDLLPQIPLALDRQQAELEIEALRQNISEKRSEIDVRVRVSDQELKKFLGDLGRLTPAQRIDLGRIARTEQQDQFRGARNQRTIEEETDRRAAQRERLQQQFDRKRAEEETRRASRKTIEAGGIPTAAPSQSPAQLARILEVKSEIAKIEARLGKIAAPTVTITPTVDDVQLKALEAERDNLTSPAVVTVRTEADTRRLAELDKRISEIKSPRVEGKQIGDGIADSFDRASTAKDKFASNVRTVMPQIAAQVPDLTNLSLASTKKITVDTDTAKLGALDKDLSGLEKKRTVRVNAEANSARIADVAKVIDELDTQTPTVVVRTKADDSALQAYRQELASLSDEVTTTRVEIEADTTSIASVNAAIETIEKPGVVTVHTAADLAQLEALKADLSSLENQRHFLQIRVQSDTTRIAELNALVGSLDKTATVDIRSEVDNRELLALKTELDELQKQRSVLVTATLQTVDIDQRIAQVTTKLEASKASVSALVGIDDSEARKEIESLTLQLENLETDRKAKLTIQSTIGDVDTAIASTEQKLADAKLSLAPIPVPVDASELVTLKTQLKELESETTIRVDRTKLDALKADVSEFSPLSKIHILTDVDTGPIRELESEITRLTEPKTAGIATETDNSQLEALNNELKSLKETVVVRVTSEAETNSIDQLTAKIKAAESLEPSVILAVDAAEARAEVERLERELVRLEADRMTKVEVDADLREADKSIEDITERIQKSKTAVPVALNSREALEEIAKLETDLVDLSRQRTAIVAAQLETDQVDAKIVDVNRQIAQIASHSLAKVEVVSDTTQLSELQKDFDRLERTKTVRVNTEINAARVKEVTAAIEELDSQTPTDVRAAVHVDRASLDALKSELEALKSPTTASVRSEADLAAIQALERLIATLEPKTVQVTAQVESDELQALRAQLKELEIVANTATVTIDDVAAVARVEALEKRLETLTKTRDLVISGSLDAKKIEEQISQARNDLVIASGAVAINITGNATQATAVRDRVRKQLDELEEIRTTVLQIKSDPTKVDAEIQGLQRQISLERQEIPIKVSVEDTEAFKEVATLEKRIADISKTRTLAVEGKLDTKEIDKEISRVRRELDIVALTLDINANDKPALDKKNDLLAELNGLEDSKHIALLVKTDPGKLDNELRGLERQLSLARQEIPISVEATAAKAEIADVNNRIATLQSPPIIHAKTEAPTAELKAYKLELDKLVTSITSHVRTEADTEPIKLLKQQIAAIEQPGVITVQSEADTKKLAGFKAELAVLQESRTTARVNTVANKDRVNELGSLIDKLDSPPPIKVEVDADRKKLEDLNEELNALEGPKKLSITAEARKEKLDELNQNIAKLKSGGPLDLLSDTDSRKLKQLEEQKNRLQSATTEGEARRELERQTRQDRANERFEKQEAIKRGQIHSVPEVKRLPRLEPSVRDLTIPKPAAGTLEDIARKKREDEQARISEQSIAVFNQGFNDRLKELDAATKAIPAPRLGFDEEGKPLQERPLLLEPPQLPPSESLEESRRRAGIRPPQVPGFDEFGRGLLERPPLIEPPSTSIEESRRRAKLPFIAPGFDEQGNPLGERPERILRPQPLEGGILAPERPGLAPPERPTSEGGLEKPASELSSAATIQTAAANALLKAAAALLQVGGRADGGRRGNGNNSGYGGLDASPSGVVGSMQD